MPEHVTTGHIIILAAILTGLRVHVFLKPRNGKGGFRERIGVEFWFMGKRYDRKSEGDDA